MPRTRRRPGLSLGRRLGSPLRLPTVRVGDSDSDSESESDRARGRDHDDQRSLARCTRPPGPGLHPQGRGPGATVTGRGRLGLGCRRPPLQRPRPEPVGRRRAHLQCGKTCSASDTDVRYRATVCPGSLGAGQPADQATAATALRPAAVLRVTGRSRADLDNHEFAAVNPSIAMFGCEDLPRPTRSFARPTRSFASAPIDHHWSCDAKA
jgi:hypothetical protein